MISTKDNKEHSLRYSIPCWDAGRFGHVLKTDEPGYQQPIYRAEQPAKETLEF